MRLIHFCLWEKAEERRAQKLPAPSSKMIHDIPAPLLSLIVLSAASILEFILKKKKEEANSAASVKFALEGGKRRWKV